MAKSTDVGGGSGAPEPAVCHYLMLESMNKSSARIGTFLARLSRPRVGSYSYQRRSVVLSSNGIGSSSNSTSNGISRSSSSTYCLLIVHILFTHYLRITFKYFQIPSNTIKFFQVPSQ